MGVMALARLSWCAQGRAQACNYDNLRAISRGSDENPAAVPIANLKRHFGNTLTQIPIIEGQIILR